MANIANDEKELSLKIMQMRSRLTHLEFTLYEGDDSHYALSLLKETNKILDCALDLSKQAAKIETAISKDRNRHLIER